MKERKKCILESQLNVAGMDRIEPEQGAYNSGKRGNLRELVNSGKLREFKFTQGIYQMLFFHDAICA